MLYDILLIFLCMFASLGIVELVLYLFNIYCAAKLPKGLFVVADGFEEKDAEYVIRQIESIISTSGLDCIITEIRLGENAKIHPELLRRLKREYGNIRG